MDQDIFYHCRRGARLYTEAFKGKVVQDYLTSGLSQKAILRKYDIGSHTAIQRWVGQFGGAAPGVKKVKFAATIPAELPKKKATTDNGHLSAQEQIRQLKKQLEDEQLRSQMYLRMIEIAETQYHIPVRKKPDTK